MQDFLSIPTGGAPPVFFHEDGTMRKTKKSDIAQYLIKDATVTLSRPHCDVYIIDMLVLLHTTSAQYTCKTFDEFALGLLTRIFMLFTYAATIICGYDVYGNNKDVK